MPTATPTATTATPTATPVAVAQVTFELSLAEETVESVTADLGKYQKSIADSLAGVEPSEVGITVKAARRLRRLLAGVVLEVKIATATVYIADRIKETVAAPAFQTKLGAELVEEGITATPTIAISSISLEALVAPAPTTLSGIVESAHCRACPCGKYSTLTTGSFCIVEAKSGGCSSGQRLAYSSQTVANGGAACVACASGQYQKGFGTIGADQCSCGTTIPSRRLLETSSASSIGIQSQGSDQEAVPSTVPSAAPTVSPTLSCGAGLQYVAIAGQVAAAAEVLVELEPPAKDDRGIVDKAKVWLTETVDGPAFLSAEDAEWLKWWMVIAAGSVLLFCCLGTCWAKRSRSRLAKHRLKRRRSQRQERESNDAPATGKKRGRKNRKKKSMPPPGGSRMSSVDPLDAEQGVVGQLATPHAQNLAQRAPLSVYHEYSPEVAHEPSSPASIRQPVKLGDLLVELDPKESAAAQNVDEKALQHWKEEQQQREQKWRERNTPGGTAGVGASAGSGKGGADGAVSAFTPSVGYGPLGSLHPERLSSRAVATPSTIGDVHQFKFDGDNSSQSLANVSMPMTPAEEGLGGAAQDGAQRRQDLLQRIAMAQERGAAGLTTPGTPMSVIAAQRQQQQQQELQQPRYGNLGCLPPPPAYGKVGVDRNVVEQGGEEDMDAQQLAVDAAVCVPPPNFYRSTSSVNASGSAGTPLSSFASWLHGEDLGTPPLTEAPTRSSVSASARATHRQRGAVGITTPSQSEVRALRAAPLSASVGPRSGASASYTPTMLQPHSEDEQQRTWREQQQRTQERQPRWMKNTVTGADASEETSARNEWERAQAQAQSALESARKLQYAQQQQDEEIHQRARQEGDVARNQEKQQQLSMQEQHMQQQRAELNQMQQSLEEERRRMGQRQRQQQTPGTPLGEFYSTDLVFETIPIHFDVTFADGFAIVSESVNPRVQVGSIVKAVNGVPLAARSKGELAEVIQSCQVPFAVTFAQRRPTTTTRGAYS
jgi:hypothetical protein